MVVARLLRALNLLLHGNLHDLPIGHFKLAHTHLPFWTRASIRKRHSEVKPIILHYLCRSV
jgi:hypothetical protein